jgi:hypothetical protein
MKFLKRMKIALVTMMVLAFVSQMILAQTVKVDERLPKYQKTSVPIP